MIHWVMDYETLSNCFVGVFEHYKTSERKIFIVHDLQNDFDEFKDSDNVFISSVMTFIE